MSFSLAGRASFTTPVVVQIYGEDLATAHPVGAPALRVIDTPARVEAALTAALVAHLADGGVEDVAPLTLPSDVRLETVQVLAPPPGGGKGAIPLPLSCIVVPGGEHAWVHVPALGEMIFVHRGESVEEGVAREVQRLLQAEGPGGVRWMDLLPPRETRLAFITVGEAHRPTEAERGEEARLRAQAVLGRVATRLTGGDAPARLVGRDAGMAQLSALLAADARGSVALLGEPGSGRGALLARWRADHPRREVWQTSGPRLLAGMGSVGLWEERVAETLAAAEALDAVIYLDDAGDLVGGRGEGAVALGAALRPWVEAQRVRLAVRATPEAWDRLTASELGLTSGMHPIEVPPLTPAETLTALKAEVRRRATRGDIPLQDDASEALVELCRRHLPYAVFPGKALRLAGELAEAQRAAHPGEAHPPMDADAVHLGFARATGLPLFLLREAEPFDPGAASAWFRSRIVGQDEAVGHVVDTLCRVKAGLAAEGRPLANFLFVGPTGVGKTEVARALAAYLFGAEGRMIRFDMSEFTDPWAAERLLRGHDGGPGLLVRAIRRQPFSVVLFDEIEKADPSVFDVLLQVLGEGRLTDAAGRTAHFSTALIILTSNLGAASLRPSMAMDARRDVDARRHYLDAAAQHFRPELLGRLDRIVPFDPLSRVHSLALTERAARAVLTRRGMTARGLTVTLTPAAVATVFDAAFDPRYGARGLRRHVEVHVAAPVAHLLAEAGPVGAGSLRVCAEDEPHAPPTARALVRGGLRFELTATPPARVRAGQRPLKLIAALRQEAARWCTQPAVVDLGVEVENLRAAVLDSATPPSDADRKQLTRLEKVWEVLRHAQDELDTFEDLAVLGSWQKEDVAEWTPEAYAALDRLKAHLPYAWLRSHPSPDGLVILAEERDTPGALLPWLSSLLSEAPGRRWRIRARRWQGDGGFSAWGDAREALARDPDDPQRAALLLEIKGPWAGAVVSQEQGLHLWEGLRPEERRHTEITVIAWDDAPLDPGQVRLAGPPRATSFVGPLRRTFHEIQASVDLGRGDARLDVPPREWWRHIDAALLALIAAGDALDPPRPQQQAPAGRDRRRPR